MTLLPHLRPVPRGVWGQGQAATGGGGLLNPSGCPHLPADTVISQRSGSAEEQIGARVEASQHPCQTEVEACVATDLACDLGSQQVTREGGTWKVLAYEG